MYIYLLTATSILTIIINTYLLVFLLKSNRLIDKQQEYDHGIVHFSLVPEETGQNEIEPTELLSEVKQNITGDSER